MLGKIFHGFYLRNYKSYAPEKLQLILPDIQEDACKLSARKDSFEMAKFQLYRRLSLKQEIEIVAEDTKSE